MNEEINLSPKNQDKGRLYRVKHRDGVHIASSNNNPNLKRANLLDDETNKPVGFAEFEPVDESEFEFEYSYDYEENQQEAELPLGLQIVAQALVEALTEVTVEVVNEYVAPLVKKWLQNNAIPTMKEKWKILKNKTKDKPSAKGIKKSKLHTIENVAEYEKIQGLLSLELDKKYEKYTNDMTSEEAQKELLDIFLLTAIIITKIRKLSNARIINNESLSREFIEGQQIVEKLTTPEYIISINQILENNPELLEEKKADLSDLLGRNLVINGQFVPIETGKFKEMLGPDS